MHSRLQKSIEDMAEFCPNFAYQSLPSVAGGGGQWKGTIQPIVSLDLVNDLLDDIHHNRSVFAAANGELRHLASCHAEHCHHAWMDRTRELRVAFSVLIHYSGGRDHPRCWILSPEIPAAKRKHSWDDGSICPFLASKDAWEWNRHTVADFAPHISIWLVTWLVYDQTSDWIVGEHEGTPEYHLDMIRPSDQCWCRSGKKYHKCHMRADQQAAALRRIRGLVV